MRRIIQWLKEISGIFSYTDPKGEYHRGKTVWDFLQLLIIPAVLTGAAIWFNQDRTREDSLQTYLDEMEHLLIDENLRTSSPDAEVRSIARARTLTVMRRLDGGRKRALLEFLIESELIGEDKNVIGLGQVSLRGADLRWINLSGADLWWADLRECELGGADLRNAYLYGADLSGANLREADLSGADLRWAHLTGAKVDDEQLEKAFSLTGATMPDGTVYNGRFD